MGFVDKSSRGSPIMQRQDQPSFRQSNLDLLSTCQRDIAKHKSLSGHHAPALALLERIIAIQPGDTKTVDELHDAWVRYGRMQAGEGRLDEAEASFRRALGLRPNQQDTIIVLAQLLGFQEENLLIAGHFSQAEAAFHEALILYPNTANALALQPQIEGKTPLVGENAGIEHLISQSTLLRLAAQKYPDQTDMRQALSDNLVEQAKYWTENGQNTKSESALRNALFQNPDNTSASTMLGIVLYQRSVPLYNSFDYAEAEALLWQSTVLFPMEYSTDLLGHCINNSMAHPIYRSQRFTPVAQHLQNILQVKDAVGRDYFRAGIRGDSGYVMVNYGLQDAPIYSLGIGWDVSWDRHLAELGGQIYQYDHTIDALPEEHPNFHWFKLGIGSSADTGPEFRTIKQLIEINGHQGRKDLVLKIDIEGYEWPVFAEMDEETLGQFSQIVGEFHNLTNIVDSKNAAKIFSALDKINAQFQLVHVHINNSGAVGNIGGVTLYDMYELTFLRRSDHTFVPSTKFFPIDLDAPCNSCSAEYIIGQSSRAE